MLRVLGLLVKFVSSLAGKSEPRIIIVAATTSRGGAGGAGGRDGNGMRDG